MKKPKAHKREDYRQKMCPFKPGYCSTHQCAAWQPALMKGKDKMGYCILIEGARDGS